MGLTLIGIFLTSLPSDWDEASFKLELSSPKFDSSNISLIYDNFITVEKHSGHVSFQEHATFLLMWLVRFHFYNSCQQVTKEFRKLALALVTCHKLSLAPLAMTYLYMGLFNLSSKAFCYFGGPFLIL